MQHISYKHLVFYFFYSNPLITASITTIKKEKGYIMIVEVVTGVATLSLLTLKDKISWPALIMLALALGYSLAYIPRYVLTMFI